MNQSNNPPSPIEFAQTVIDELNVWLGDNPIVENEDQARALKPMIDRTRAALVDIEETRMKLVTPLNQQVSSINADHKQYHNADKKGTPGIFDKVLFEALRRVQSFMIREEERRRKEADAALQLAREAEQKAREAEAREKEVHEDASMGVVGLSVQDATKAADTAFSDFKRASRFAELAERETKVKIAGGFSRSLSIKNKEILEITDAAKILSIIGLTARLKECIYTEARAFKKEWGEWPDGISVKTERVL